MLLIVSVKGKSVKGNRMVEMYTFLDPGSTATFCTEELMQDLRVTGRKANIFLSTMGQKGPVHTHVVWKSVAWRRTLSWGCLKFSHKRKYQSSRKIFHGKQMLIDGHIDGSLSQTNQCRCWIVNRNKHTQGIGAMEGYQ